MREEYKKEHEVEERRELSQYMAELLGGNHTAKKTLRPSLSMSSCSSEKTIFKMKILYIQQSDAIKKLGHLIHVSIIKVVYISFSGKNKAKAWQKVQEKPTF